MTWKATLGAASSIVALLGGASVHADVDEAGAQLAQTDATPPSAPIEQASQPTVDHLPRTGHVTTGVSSPNSLTATDAAGGLSLEAVLESTWSHHPQVLAAMQSEDIARAELMAAQGGFDPQLDLSSKLRSGGYYELRRLDAELRQPTALWGTEVYAGYRLGRGIESDRYPSYYNDETLDGGEFRVGARVPLLKDGPFDKRRAAVADADWGVSAAEEQRLAVRLALQQSATDAYFGWVAAGREAKVAEQLLQLAEARREFVNARVAAGAVAEVESLEVVRSVLNRRASLLKARRGQERQAVRLSLYHRNTQGMPLVPPADSLPEVLPVPAPLPQEVPGRAALECIPAIAQKRAKVAQARVKVDLARAQLAPSLDLSVEASRDVGGGDSTLPGTVFEGGLKFSLPLLLRSPRGNLEAAEGLVEQLEQELRFLQDKVLAAQQDALIAERYARQRYEVAAELLTAIEELADAERKRFEAGSTSLFMVNQREQALAEAALELVDSARELWSARAAYQAVTTCGRPQS